MDKFETIVIFKPIDTAKEEIKMFTNVIQNLNKTKKVKVENMGVKNLAYEVQNHKQGHYALFYWQGNEEDVLELERRLRIDDDVLKFMTMKNSELPELEDYDSESEQKKSKPDALDVLLGLADYKKKEEEAIVYAG